ncbi:MAG: DUF4349 domain-containing protein [Clostridia bacterium]|nr:DUF4349 domain-containing protein [Clostridia bacterium]
MKKIRLISLICVLTLLLCSCGAKNDLAASDSAMNGSNVYYDKSYDADYGYNSAPEASYPTKDDALAGSDISGSGVDADKIAESERKLIKNGNFTIETLEYEKTINAIEDLIASVGGYVQNSNVSGTGAISSGYAQMRKATYTVRLPADDFGSFEEGLSACGSVLSRYVYVDEVTDYYYDSEARLKSLQLQEEQLMELMGKADKLEVIIQLQQELSNVRYQIESIQGTLRRLDSQIAYSTVTITIREVYESTVIQTPPKTLGQRISYTFSNTWDDIVDGVEDFVVFVAGNILLLVFWGAVITVAVIFVVRRIRRRKTKKTVIAPQQQDDNE